MLGIVKTYLIKKLVEIDIKEVLRTIGGYFADRINGLKGKDDDGNGVDDFQDLLDDVQQFVALGARIIDRIRRAEK